VKLRLQISTNIPPGFGTAVGWDNSLLPSNGVVACSSAAQTGYLGAEQGCGADGEQQAAVPAVEAAAEAACRSGQCTRWRGDGSGAPLISALQKSVRRGCAASATRCVQVCDQTSVFLVRAGNGCCLGC
jgi:hypothetical protein